MYAPHLLAKFAGEQDNPLAERKWLLRAFALWTTSAMRLKHIASFE